MQDQTPNIEKIKRAIAKVPDNVDGRDLARAKRSADNLATMLGAELSNLAKLATPD